MLFAAGFRRRSTLYVSSWYHCQQWLSKTVHRAMCLHTVTPVCDRAANRYHNGGLGIISPSFLQSGKFASRTALVCGNAHYTYLNLLSASSRLADNMCEVLASHKGVEHVEPYDIRHTAPRLEVRERYESQPRLEVRERYESQPRVAILCENDITYVSSLWASWQLGCIAVPVCKTYPQEEMRYILRDSGASIILSSPEFSVAARALAADCQIAHLDVMAPGIQGRVAAMSVQGMEEKWGQIRWGELGAVLVYTSGTTGRPKGVLSTHYNVSAQVSMLLEAWGWTSEDVLLHVLPLHHLHGIVNGLLSALSSGATVIMQTKFDPEQVWRSLLNEEAGRPPVTVFTGVPTMYAKLLQHFRKAGLSSSRRERIREHFKERVRLVMSGSAALPQPVFEQWSDVTGQHLLERYGMTEIGMALSNPLHGLRIPGSVGIPLPTVEVRIAPGDDSQEEADASSAGVTGELQVRGPAVFEGYWGKLQETKESFTEDGWFKTGDRACCKDGIYQILGRESVDIIKSGGYKISALEIERVMLEHPDVTDCAVVGLPDEVWGETVAAIIVSTAPEKVTMETMVEWCKTQLAPYKLPRVVHVLESMPRNAMGKVNKKDLKRTVFNA